MDSSAARSTLLSFTGHTNHSIPRKDQMAGRSSENNREDNVAATMVNPRLFLDSITRDLLIIHRKQHENIGSPKLNTENGSANSLLGPSWDEFATSGGAIESKKKDEH